MGGGQVEGGKSAWDKVTLAVKGFGERFTGKRVSVTFASVTIFACMNTIYRAEGDLDGWPFVGVSQ